MIIISGASKGIGKFLLESFLERKFNQVIGFYHSTFPEKNNEYYYKLDITNLEKVNNFFGKHSEELNELVLINCAAIAYDSYLHKSNPDKWKEVIMVNILGTYNLIRSLLPIMRNQKYGRIINFSSVLAEKPTPGVSCYAASKSALWGMSKSIAIENSSLNITINNINLGYTKLGMTNLIPEKFMKTIINQIPTGKLCKPSDILNTVDYLINTEYINGSSISINGGLL